MADLLKAQGDNPNETEDQRVSRLRQQGIGQAQNLANVTQQNATDLQATGTQALGQAESYGRRDVASQAAEALANARSQGAKGGISYGGLLQAGTNTGLAQAQVESGIADKKLALTKDVGDARQTAAAQALQATQFAQNAGSSEQDRQKKKAQYDAQLQDILQSTKGFFNDDEALAQQKIEAMVASETDPVLKQYYITQAQNYGSKADGYDY